MIEEVRNRGDLVALVNETGFLPFFSGRIEGFSLEENISYDAWYQGRWSGKIHCETRNLFMESSLRKRQVL